MIRIDMILDSAEMCGIFLGRNKNLGCAVLSRNIKSLFGQFSYYCTTQPTHQVIVFSLIIDMCFDGSCR